ncbi:hypothetical protein RPHASCH2410_PC00335 (plasmid) [Rhizobium phaseoli Ch24-10]|nr:hypothetical protein RPHASCH2410_PC00335 [Rhizobium phaseoli Ch24-10]
MISNSAGYSYNVQISSNLEHAPVCIVCPRSGSRSANLGQIRAIRAATPMAAAFDC